MELHLNVAWEGNQEGSDLTLSFVDEHTVDDLASALDEHFDCNASSFELQRDDRRESLDRQSLISDIGLVSGDRIEVNRTWPGEQTTTNLAPLARVAVASGIDAGRSFNLHEGRFTIGRDEGSSIRLNDPSVALTQMTVEVEDGQPVRVLPNLAATNPVRIAGHEVIAATTLDTEDVIHLGATSLRIRRPKTEVPSTPSGSGHIDFNRTPYFRELLPSIIFDPIGSLPTKGRQRRFQGLALVTPLLLGVAMALILGNPRFLLFAVLSPVAALLGLLDQRRQGGAEYRDVVADFEERLEERCADVAAALRDERRIRVGNDPDLELLARRADNKHSELWQRDRTAVDFLTLRPGLGLATPQVSVAAETTGDPEFRLLVEERMRDLLVMDDAPIPLPMADLGAVALVGDGEEATRLAAALAVQCSCLHSPEDVVVVAAVSAGRSMVEWMKWLPHTRAASSPLAGRHLATTIEDADRLLGELVAVVEHRAAAHQQNLDRRWPWIFAIIDHRLRPDAALVSRLLDAGSEAGVSVVSLVDGQASVPRQAQAVVECSESSRGARSVIRYTDPENDDHAIDLEQLAPDVARSIAMAMAPMRDASASNAMTSIPARVSLNEAFDVSAVDQDWVAGNWKDDRGYALVAPIGATDRGPLRINLVEHGPHGLIGGTSGAGKSELVQSIVASLAAHNPPHRLNFLFVDYKGGSFCEPFHPLPHTVGAVTNLDSLLASRALTSLTAELDRRMKLFKGQARDLKEMLARHPDDAPASLVIVVDEFAALVRELPDFVDGVVSIAERGRSLGIHLLLSTQRPSNAIDANIQQNTNLRIALRMLDQGESQSVISAPDAAMIPVPLKGRGLARFGPSELVPFQAAWSGAPLLVDSGKPPVAIQPFGTAETATGPTNIAEDHLEGRTQLDSAIEAIVAATEQHGYERGRSPWKEPLPSNLPLATVLADPRSADGDSVGEAVSFGMIDDPHGQDQYPAIVDFGKLGSFAVFGNGGAGKTTALISLAVSAATRDSEAGRHQLTIFGIDFASRDLGMLLRLPQTSVVATADDLEAVTRVLSLLGGTLSARRKLAGDAVASGTAHPDFTKVLLFVDGYENLNQAFEARSLTHNLGQWFDLTNQLIIEGRQYGIHVAFTATRAAAVGNNVMSSISNRIVLRQSDTSAYTDFGVPPKIATDLILRPGQGFTSQGLLLQVGQATTTGDLAALAQTLTGSVAPELQTARLPNSVPLNSLRLETEKSHAIVGIADETLEPVDIDLTHNDVVVLGHPRSGRSTALKTIASQLVAKGWQVAAVGPPDSPLADLDGLSAAGFGRLPVVIEALDTFAQQVITEEAQHAVLIFDNADQYDSRDLDEPAEILTNAGVRIIGSADSFRAYVDNPFYDELKQARTQLLLAPDSPHHVFELLGVMPKLRPGVPMPPGRGVLVYDRTPIVVQAFQGDS